MENKQRYALAVALLAWLGAGAQILNIDKPDTAGYSPAAKWAFQFNTGLEIDRQKTTLYDASNAAELLLQKDKSLALFSSSYRFTYNGPDDFLNTGYLHLRYRYRYRDRFEPETFVQYQWDNVRGLEHRFLYGANERFNFDKRGTLQGNAGIGLFFERERWNYAGVDSSKLPAAPVPITNNYIKLNTYLRFDWKASTNSDLVFVVFLQGRPDAYQPRVAPSVQWNVSASRHIGLTLAFASVYDAAPVVPIHHFYYSLSNGINLHW